MGCAIFFCLTFAFGFATYHGISYIIPIMCLALIVLIFVYIQKQEQTNVPEMFPCPCVPLVPLIGAGSMILMSSFVSVHSWIIMLLYIIFGIATYFAYGYWQSNLNPKNREKADITMYSPEGSLKEKLNGTDDIELKNVNAVN
eukprot:TRINITY_DN1725_c0_g1_i14.p1 TRINITY_DN1725_c0_g1~~TRINITY_DN1725_c0_g1_i14.p1  ORF type:complete len:143 (+),score=5.20 TRINITY_DN1725_c0_g1_i14:132-560(+)